MTSGLTGILYASFEMVRQLEEAGHRVTYACPADVKSKVEANGMTYLQLAPTNFKPAPELPKFSGPLRKFKSVWYRLRHAAARQQQAVNSLHMEAFEQTLDRLSPDLVLIDLELHDHLMTCVARRLPTLLLNQFFSVWRRPNFPSLTTDIIPGEGWRGSQAGIALSWQKIRWQRWWLFFKARSISLGLDRRSVLKKYAQKIGFPKAYIGEDHWPGPFLYRSLPVLNMATQAMEFPHAPPPYLHYISAMVFTQRKSLRSDAALKQPLQALFQQKVAEQRSLIYCSVSTLSKSDGHFLKRVVQAVAHRPDWLLILSLGGLKDVKTLGEIPENVYPFSWVPQLEVLAQADCAIVHGGVHSLNECIHFKVPMLVYSGKKSDQNGCAARVAYHGVGIRADKDIDSDAAIRANLEHVLQEDSFREKLEVMHGHYLADQKEQRLLRMVEQSLGGSLDGKNP